MTSLKLFPPVLGLLIVSATQVSAFAADTKSLKKIEEKVNSLSLQQCIRLGLENRKDLRIADRMGEDFFDSAKGVKSAVLPSVRLDTTYTSRNNDQGVKGFANIFGDRESKTAKVTLMAPLYDFGGTPARIRTAEEAGNAQVNYRLRTAQEIALAISEQYFQILDLKKQNALLKESFALVKEQLAAAKDFFAQGLVAKNDVLSVETRLAEMAQLSSRLKNSERLALAGLNRLMGFSVDRETKISDVAPPNEKVKDLRHYVEKAPTLRPDLRALTHKKLSLLSDKTASGKALTPGIAAFGEYNWSGDDMLAHQTWMMGGITMRWNLYDSGVMKYNLRQKDRGIANLDDQMSELKENISLEVEQAWFQFNEAKERSLAAKTGILAAEENLRVTREQYGRGLATSSEVLQEEERLHRIRVQFFESVYDQHRALARLEFAVGLSAETKE